jgi:hypothetical protein
VLNREIPFCKIKKVIRFRITEIEKWVDNSGVYSSTAVEDNTVQTEDSELFDETGTGSDV